jgi:hypothetical protein
MANHESSDEELSGLLDALALGELDQASAEALCERLRTDPEARRAYLESVCFDALLQREFPRLSGIIVNDDAAGSARAHSIVEARPQRCQSQWRQWTAAAAIAMLGVSIAVYFIGTQTPSFPSTRSVRVTEIPLSVATVTNLRDAAPVPGQKPFALGQRVVRGSYAVASGSIELTFDCGAVVVLEGPARLTLESEYQARIERGRLRADVPRQAIGFLIETPRGTVRDLGTAFGVDVAQTGTTELHVLQGKVEALHGAKGAKQVSTLVNANEAVTMLDSARLNQVSFRPEEFVPILPARPPLRPPEVHWSFDPPDAVDQTSDGVGSRPYHLILKRAGQSDPSPETRAVPGVFGSALTFNGRDETAVSDYPGIAGSAPRTVTAWVRIPRDSRLDRQNGIIGWGRFARGEKWQLATNIIRREGTVGALRQEFGFGYIIGSTDLRDGAWHHIAVVFHGGPNTDVTTDVKLYVDGRLEILSGQKRQEIVTATGSVASSSHASAPYPVMLGARLPLRRSSGEPAEIPPWRGALDEVHIFSGALSPAQIVTLMSRNKLD